MWATLPERHLEFDALLKCCVKVKPSYFCAHFSSSKKSLFSFGLSVPSIHQNVGKYCSRMDWYLSPQGRELELSAVCCCRIGGQNGVKSVVKEKVRMEWILFLQGTGDEWSMLQRLLEWSGTCCCRGGTQNRLACCCKGSGYNEVESAAWEGQNGVGCVLQGSCQNGMESVVRGQNGVVPVALWESVRMEWSLCFRGAVRME